MSCRPSLRLVDAPQPAPPPPPAPSNVTRWAINGYPATVTVWTPEEWARLAVKPPGVEACPNGCYVRLSIA